MSVFFQDIKERKVYWFLFPLIGLLSGILLFKNVFFKKTFFLTCIINLSFVTILIVFIFIYSKFKLKLPVNQTFGLGDALLFFALSFTFLNVSFFIFFIFGLVFSLMLHLFVKQKKKQETVPLAGYLSLFFALIYISHWAGIVKTVYSI